MASFSIGESIKFGWSTFNGRRGFYLGASAIIFGISLVWDWLSSGLQHADTSAGPITAVVVGVVVSALLSMGEIHFGLRAHDAPHDVRLKDLWAPRHFWYFVVTGILSGLIILGGLILVVIPAFVFALMIMFAGYAVVDEGRGPITSIKESARLTKGHRWKLLGFVLATLGINILGFIALIVGLLVTMPVTLIATAYVYRSLQQGNLQSA